MKKTLLLIAAGLLSTAVSQAVTEAYSPVLGGNMITLTGAVSGIPKITTFSPALRMTVSASFVGKARGTLTAVSDILFTDNTAGWSAAAISQAAAPYFVRIRSGAAAGTWWQVSTSTASTSTAFSVLNRGFSPTGLGVAVGDVYELVPGDTLGTFFAAVAPQIGGTSASTADIVRVHDGSIWKEYFYNTSDSKWHEGATPFDRTNIVLRPDSGIVFIRRLAGNVTIAMVGSVSDTDEKIVVPTTGVTFVASVFPVPRKLGSFNLQNMPGFVRYSTDMAAADKVTLHDGAIWKTYNYNQASSQWREGITPFDRTNYDVPFGTPFIIARGAGATGGASLLTLFKPY